MKTQKINNESDIVINAKDETLIINTLEGQWNFYLIKTSYFIKQIDIAYENDKDKICVLRNILCETNTDLWNIFEEMYKSKKEDGTLDEWIARMEREVKYFDEDKYNEEVEKMIQEAIKLQKEGKFTKKISRKYYKRIHKVNEPTRYLILLEIYKKIKNTNDDGKAFFLKQKNDYKSIEKFMKF
jgi:hypothetical protein